MFCHKCGAQLAEGALFCQKCGAKVMPAEGELHPTPQATDEQSKPSSKETAKQPSAAPTKVGTTPNLIEGLIRIGAVALPLLAVYALIAAIVGFSVNRMFAAVLLILGFLGAVSKALSGLFRKSKVLVYVLLGLAAILSIIVLGALMRASQSENTSSNVSPNNSNLVSSDGRIVVSNTQHFDDIAFGNMELTLDYVQFTDSLQDAWTGNYIYPDEGFIFLWASFTLENTGTTNSTLPTAWSTIVYDGTYEFQMYNTTGNLSSIPPLSAPTEGAIIFKVPTAVMESDKPLVLNIGGFADRTVLSYTIRSGDKLQGNFADGTTGMGSPAYPDEVLFNGTPASELIRVSLDPIMSAWGTPLSFTEGWGVNLCEYDGILFEFDSDRIIYSTTVNAEMCSWGRVSLNKNRAELIEILGTPTSEGWSSRYNYMAAEGADPFEDIYFMRYEEGHIDIQLPSPDAPADKVYIWGS